MEREFERDPFGLRAAPRSRAPEDLWQSLSDELDRGRAPARAAPWIAATAAVAALALAVPLIVDGPSPTEPSMSNPLASTATATPAATGIEALRDAQVRSALLERRIDALDDRSVSAGALERIVMLESELRWIDELISSDPDRLELWQQRNELLGEMGQRYAMNDWQTENPTLVL